MKTGKLDSDVVSRYAPVLSCEGDTVLTDAHVKEYFVFVGTTKTSISTLRLPTPVKIGSMITIYCAAAAGDTVRIDPLKGRIVLDGLAGSAGKRITSSGKTLGDYVTLIGDSTSGWTVIGRSGVWTLES